MGTLRKPRRSSAQLERAVKFTMGTNDKPRTNTASKIIMQNGECFGVLHAHKLTGYKAPNAYGHSPAFPKGTCYKDAFKQSSSPHASPSVDGTLPKKDLCTYDPNSLRSRL